MSATVYIVHCVDTEGPLYEPLEATFDRLKEIYGLKLEPSAKTLAQLQKGTLDLGSEDVVKAVAQSVDPKHLDYNDTWEKIDAMLDRLDSPDVRMALSDCNDHGWRINWHCLAHHGFDPAKNPRRRALGVHTIFDHYTGRYAGSPLGDSIHWHFHPVPRTRQVNHCATAYLGNPVLFEIISRRILERQWFPCVNRPGFHAERPDSNWFLEQWLPFDIANINAGEKSNQPDLNYGRFGDWRRAPREWSVYHPDHNDYQIPGSCNRAISRCLYLGGRFSRINQVEVDKAFAMARTGDVVMAFTNHDFRDIIPDINEMQEMLKNAHKRFPDVHWEYSDAANAMRRTLGLDDAPHAIFDLSLTPVKGLNSHRLDIRLDRTPFGPQPWFCYKMKDGSVWHDNLDFGLEPCHWHYTFDEQNSVLGDIAMIGLATNSREGRTTVTLIDPTTGETNSSFHN